MSPTAATAPAPSARPAAGVAGSAWLRDLLVGTECAARVTGVGRAAAYVTVAPGTLLAVETAGGVGLPNAVVTRLDGVAPAGWAVGDPVVVGGGGLRVAGRALRVARWWDPRPRVGRVGRAAVAGRSAALPTEPPAAAPFGLAAPVGRLRGALAAGDVAAAVAVVPDLLGRGPGSTPSGDDVLAGLLATVRVLGPALGGRPAERAAALAAALAAATVPPAATRTTGLSATLLRCADDGAVVRPAAAVLRALAGSTPIAPAVAALARVGHTSGRDLLVGIALGATAITTDPSPKGRHP